MAMSQNDELLQYHMSIGSELESVKNRIRMLIGKRHWLTDGEHKEAILRRVLRNHVPEMMRVGTGFIYYSTGKCSTQQDILITDLTKPSLFKDEGLTVVTAEAVRVVIEVKTNIRTRKDFQDVANKLAGTVSDLRKTIDHHYYTAGLFVYEEQGFRQDLILSTLQEITKGNLSRVVDFVAFGANTFIKFDRARHHWTLYNLEQLAQAYFVSNIVWRTTTNNPRSMRFAWFPLKSDEKYQAVYQASLLNGTITEIFSHQEEEYITES